ncbi:uncharacterized protein LOC121290087 [Carcharodon carcharias]|uniref:uncharacterized protein LOC121290087 n=1 Tax=Carcharodon carcharias TaxID=13397 RepID=UPI001B7E188C|nr:uncharacterized protein LOC121290087 [Carcharodon carcharias]
MYPAAGLYGPLVPRRFVTPAEAFALPPIQMHNFSSRPLTIVMTEADNSQEGIRKHTEYHHFYGTPYFYPYWYMPPANPAAYMYPLYYPHNGYFPQQQMLGMAGWPEGFSMKGELHWGKMERVFGPKRELPDFVQDELRRVYGTYPKTIVTVTYQNGEYLVKGDPKVGEQKYKVEKKVIRRPPTPSDEEGDSISEVVEKRKRRSKR